MKSFLNIAAIFLALAIKPDPTKMASPEPTPEPTPITQTEKKDRTDMDLSAIDVGIPVKGIKIPYYDTDGTTLRMTFEAGEARRLDDTRILMHDLRILSHGEDTDFRAVFDEAILDMATRILSGEHGVTIRRNDLDLKADKGEFNTETRYGKVLGNITMTIYNTN